MADFDPQAWLAQGESEYQASQPLQPQQSVPQSEPQSFDANAWLNQGEQEFKQISPQSGVGPVVAQNPVPAMSTGESGAHTPAQGGSIPPVIAGAGAAYAPPIVTDVPMKQTGKNSFQLGLDAAGQWFNNLPLVQEVKNNPVEQTAQNIDTGIPYGMLQLGDVAENIAYPVNWAANQIVGAVPRGIEGTARMLSGGKFESPTVDKVIPQYQPLHAAQKYRDYMSQQEGYSPETFKLGGMAGQMALPMGTGLEAGSAATAAGLGALENAIVGGITNAGDQLGETGKIDPMQLALTAGLSAPLGAIGGAAGYGLGKLGSKIFGKGAQELESNLPKLPEGMSLDQLFRGPEVNAQARSLESLGLKRFADAAEQPQAAQEAGIINQLAPQPVSSELPVSPVERAAMPLKGNVSEDNGAVFRHRRTAFGRNKADEGQLINQFAPKTQSAAQMVAEAKVQLDYQTAVLNDYKEKLWKIIEDRGLAPGGAFVAKNGAFMTKEQLKELEPHAEKELTKLREKLSTGVQRTTGSQHVSAITGGKFGGEGNFGLKIPNTKLPDDVERAFDHAVTLERAVKKTQKRYDALKAEGKAHFEAEQTVMRQKNPQASFNASTSVKTPFKEEVDVNVSLDHNAMRHKLSKESEEIVAAARSKKFEEQAENRNYQPKFDFKMNTKNVAKAKKALALAAGSLALTQGKAKAEDGEDEKEGFDYSTAGRIALGAAALAYASPKLAAKIINPENTRLSLLFNDTVQRIEALDLKMGTKTANEIWQHLGAVHNASFGVKIDADLRQQAMQMLRDGEMGSFKKLNLNAEQQTALLTYDEVRRNLTKIVDKQIAEAKEALAEMDARDLKSTGMELGLDALKEMRTALVGKETSELNKAYSAGLRKFMDYHFFYNPAFHLTNLSDQLISVAPRVGPMNLYSANKALVGNAKLRKLFHHSNLAGGFEAEKIQAGVVGGTAVPKKRFELKDFKSDKVNADRAALAAMFQYRQLNKLAGSDEEFAEKLLSNQLQPDEAVDAWAHVAETLSRTLGADPMRVNMDIFAAQAPFLSAFVRQPARVSNLMLHYLANDPKKFYVMMGAMALAGGNSAIPIEAQETWKRVDPKAYFMAAKVLDHMEVASYLTGKSLTPKTQWSVLAPVAMSSDPLRSTAGNVITSSIDTLQKISEGEFSTEKANQALGNIASLFKPRFLGGPVKQALGIEKAAEESIRGTKKISYYGKLGRYGQSEDVSLDELGINPIKNFFDQFAPGVQNAVKTRQLAKEEEHFREHNLMNWINDATQGAQSWNIEDGYQKDPTNAILRAIAGTKRE